MGIKAINSPSSIITKCCGCQPVFSDTQPLYSSADKNSCRKKGYSIPARAFHCCGAMSAKFVIHFTSTTIYRMMSIPNKILMIMLTDKPFSQACENNQQPILEIIREVFSKPSTVWEIGSGTGQHACYFAR
jgi:hypothetical protein